MMESTRLDKWLVAVRVYKNRTVATEACAGGKVRINGAPVKPASQVRAGDRVEARVGKRERVFEVVKIIDKRVGAPIAAECYIDHSPPPEPSERLQLDQAVREAGAGRPTKRDRRRIDKFRGR